MVPFRHPCAWKPIAWIRATFLVLCGLALGLAIAPARAAAGHETNAALLVERGRQRLTGASADSQRAGLADLEEAARLAPDRRDVWLALGRACLDLGRVGRARACLTRVTRLASDDPEAWSLLTTAWKEDWLHSLDRSSLEQARRCAERAARAAPERAEAWVATASLDLLLGRPRDALAAAAAARRADSASAEPLLVMAAACDRSGDLPRAELLFRAARDRLGSWDDSFAWDGADPDRTTPENEAELDARTRWTLARFLFREGDALKWDRRAELFVRYGPPASIEYDPAWAQVGEDELAFAFPRHAHIRYAPDPIPDPYHMQVWHYPELGFDAVLWDRALSQSYEFPYANDRTMDPRPDPGALAARADLVSLDGGRGVFRALPPGTEPMSLRAAVHRFPVEDGMRLVAHVFSPGTPVERLVGSWSVIDEQGRVVHRATGPLSVSACDPGSEQVIQFDTRLPTGSYRIDVSVQGAGRRRGLAHLGVRAAPSAPGPAMSDLVLLCGEAAPGGDAVRIEPDVEGRIGGARSIVVYYELEHLATDSAGTARFSYTCTVLPLGRRARGQATVYEATREEENVGSHRRQFVTIPVASLKKGEYEIRMAVRDLESGQDVAGTTSFTKGDPSSLAETSR